MTTRYRRPWLCAFCGYTCDAAGGLDHDATPKQGDVALCLNCGLIHQFDGDRFRPATAAEIAAFPPYLRQDIARAERARRAAALPDLARRGARA